MKITKPAAGTKMPANIPLHTHIYTHTHTHKCMHLKWHAIVTSVQKYVKRFDNYNFKLKLLLHFRRYMSSLLLFLVLLLLPLAMKIIWENSVLEFLSKHCCHFISIPHSALHSSPARHTHTHIQIHRQRVTSPFQRTSTVCSWQFGSLASVSWLATI